MAHNQPPYQRTIRASQRTYRTKRPSCVILNYKIVEKYKYNIDNPVDNLIRQNYHQIFGINYKNFIIYKIK